MDKNKEMIEQIRSKYTEKEVSKMDELRQLDAKVKKPATLFGYIFGSLGVIIMGSGMSLIMTDINTYLGLDNALVVGIVVGVIGLVMTVTTYPIYKKILASRRKKYADLIIELSDQITVE